MTNLSVNFCGTQFKNPIVVASGTFGNGQEYGEYYALGHLGGITSKAVTVQPKQGNPTPRIVKTPGHSMLNAIGLQNNGLDYFVEHELPYLINVQCKSNTPVIVNISGESVQDYVTLAARLGDLVKFIELNISCPNVKEGMLFGQDPELAAEVVAAVKAVSGQAKVIVKLTPNVTDITQIAQAVERAGADAISLINTISAMRIDPKTGRITLANRVGGLSGPAIFPIAVRCVWQVSNAVNLPIIGMGGVSSGENAVEMMRAGATLVGVGTANFYDVDNRAAPRIIEELNQYCQQIHEKDVSALIKTAY